MALINVGMFLSTIIVKHDGHRLMSTHKHQGITALQAPKRDCVLTSRADGSKDCTSVCEGETHHPVLPYVQGFLYMCVCFFFKHTE